jgi:hypothetical protein
VDLEKTETMTTLKSLVPLSIFHQSAGGDAGGAGVGDDVKLDARAKELMASDPELKELARTDRHQAYKNALVLADREFRTAK